MHLPIRQEQITRDSYTVILLAIQLEHSQLVQWLEWYMNEIRLKV